MKNMNNLVFPYDSSEHGSLTKKIVGVISNNKEIELPYLFQKQSKSPCWSHFRLCKTGQNLFGGGFGRGGQYHPLQTSAASAGSALAACLQKWEGEKLLPAELPSLGIIKVWFMWVWKEVRSIQFAWLPPCISLESPRIGGVVIFPFHCGSQCLKTAEFLPWVLLTALEKFAPVYTEPNYFEPFQFPFFALLSHVVAGTLVIVIHFMTWYFWILDKGPAGALCGSKPSKFCFCPQIFLLQVNAAVLSNSSCVFLWCIARVF